MTSSSPRIFEAARGVFQVALVDAGGGRIHHQIRPQRSQIDAVEILVDEALGYARLAFGGGENRLENPCEFGFGACGQRSSLSYCLRR